MKKKGFTLIELLAVIVILAVVALISMPLVLNTIDKAKKGAAIESANGVISAAENKYMSSMIIGKTDTRFDFPSDTKLSIKGTKPTSGTVVVDKSGNISATLEINGYCIEKTFSESSPKVVEKSPCTISDSELLEAEKYKDSVLNGADPVINSDLVAVTIENDGTVKKADIKKEWYNYKNKVWANAVILSDKTKSYSDGEVIPESNIESYFVWIPRYKYRIFNEGNYTNYIEGKPESSSKPDTIEIVFENKDTSVSKGSKVGEYLTHPAFTSFESNGFWMGKFEVTGSTSNITVKPNNTSLRNINVKTMFELAYNYKRNLDSHMLKNTEWGAATYLSYSAYGINDEVNINNNSNFVTGYSAVEGTDQSSYPGTYGTASNITLAYNTETGYKASTTGNISGVYDMSGGAWEYMASYVKDTYKDSGFDAASISKYDSKYFDIYPSDSGWTSYNKRILGDATGEMGPFYYYKDKDGNNRIHNSWFGDLSDFVDASYPWFARGGHFTSGVLAGQSYFLRSSGGAYGWPGFRIALTN